MPALFITQSVTLCVDEPIRVMPIFRPFISAKLLISGRAMKENTKRLATPAMITTSAPLSAAVTELRPSM